VTKIVQLRIFDDAEGVPNLCVKDVDGQLLVVSQFTLYASTKKGNRPSFASAAPPEQGRELFAHLQTLARQNHPLVAFGQFGADMQVALVNNGPVTFTLRT
jgi:D-tyrosyl-tRNA(Tyr) deacylase